MELSEARAAVNGGHIINSSPSLTELHLSLLLAPVSRVQKGPSFLKLSLKGIGTPVSKTRLLCNLTALAGLILKEALYLPELTLLAWSRAISSSLMSDSSFFLILRASAFALASASKEAWSESMARWWFLRVLSNSSTFSWIFLSIS